MIGKNPVYAKLISDAQLATETFKLQDLYKNQCLSQLDPN